MSVKHIFFDLDRTLWDFEENSTQTLTELIIQFNLIDKGVKNIQDFIKRYRLHNERLWDLYRQEKITKNELRGSRFLLTLEEYGIYDVELAEEFGIEYVKQSPLKTILFPFTIEVLNYLKNKYTLHIITNGFEEVQHIKLSSSDLTKYFNVIVTSEEVGVKKPNKRIFQYALDKANTIVEESIMIGDDLLVDIRGAENIGMKTIYFNPKKVDHQEYINTEISCLSELMNLL